MADIIFDCLLDTLIDGVKLIPFLYLTYLAMEYLEHKASSKTNKIIQKSGKWGPFFGSVIGIVPQCGFSAAASGLYAGRIISMGTLISVYLSTSDEMLPILISQKVSPTLILEILGLKVVIGMIAGFAIEAVHHFLNRKNHVIEAEELKIHELCDHEHCHCNEKNIFASALYHTVQVLIYILLISLAINLVVALVGEDRISAFLVGKRLLSVLISALVGLIPNCASSVVITQLYLEGILGFGAMIGGLLVGSGVGLLILFKVNESLKENLKILGILYFVGAFCGLILSLVFG